MAGIGSSCIADNPGVVVGDEFETVDFTITVPTAGNSDTRALGTGDDEYRIEQLDVLQFVGGTFAHSAAPSYDNITHTGDTFSFSVRMMKGEGQDIVVVANAKDKLNAVAGSWNNTTATQTALNQLKLTLGANDKMTVTDGVMARLPMFGIRNNENIDENSNFTATGSGSIVLVRMVAKIEIVLTEKAAKGSGDDSGAYAGTDNSNFRITDVLLYNQPTEGWVAPDAGNWPSDNVAVAPWYGGKTAPGKAAYLVGGGGDAPLHYTGTGDNVTDNAVRRSIYTFEAPAGEPKTGNYHSNTCIVMGGYYNGATGTNKSYYRIDFRDDAGGYMPLLRNHNYTVRVQSVTGGGYNRPEDAFENDDDVNITAVVESWRDQNIDIGL